VSSADRTVAALDKLAEALRQTVTELEVLVERAAHLRDEVASGRPLQETMAGEARPLIITQLVTITDRLHEAGGAVRRTEARQLRDEGCTHEQIAEIFGVTRQRASALLKPPPAEPRRPKRPKPQR